MPIIWPDTVPQKPVTHRKRASVRPYRIPAEKLSYIDQLIAECGHITIPSNVAALVDKKRKHVFCPECNTWQWSKRRATAREVYNDALGLPLDYEPDPLPDIPPF